jgi:hypothetical protein
MVCGIGMVVNAKMAKNPAEIELYPLVNDSRIRDRPSIKVVGV